MGGAEQMQICEWWMSRTRGPKKEYGLVALSGATEGRVGRDEQVGFAVDSDGVIARIGGVGRCAAAQIARPFDSGAVGVVFAHKVFLCGVGCRVVGCFTNSLWIAMRAT